MRARFRSQSQLPHGEFVPVRLCVKRAGRGSSEPFWWWEQSKDYLAALRKRRPYRGATTTLAKVICLITRRRDHLID